MPVSKDKKIWFTHIPRTGGTSVISNERFVTEWRHLRRGEIDGLDGLKFNIQHFTPSEMISYNLVDTDLIESSFKFAFVRNPWDKLVSNFFRGYHEDFDSFADFINHVQEFHEKCSGIDSKFEELRWQFDIEDSSEYVTTHHHYRPQFHFLQHQGIEIMDFVGRFERYTKDFYEICSLLGKKRPNMLHYYKTKGKRHYSTYYSSETKKTVSKLFERDIDTFKYTFEKEK